MKLRTILSLTTLLLFHVLTFGQTGNTQQGAVGAMGGVFGVSPMGGATYSIPISVPQGVGGMQPSLSIVYNSQSGNGIVGYGASLSGLSAITRSPGDIYHDGVAKALTYTSSDAFCLNGVRLIYTSGTAGQEGAVYNPESDPFTTVTIHGTYSSSDDNTWFEVKTPDGLTYKYGNTADSRHSYTSLGRLSSIKILSWYLSSVEDVLGNDMHYTYDSLNNYTYLSSIDYGTNKNDNSCITNTVSFTYETRTDVQPFIFDGVSGSMDRRLSTITCKTGETVLHTYTMQYNTTGDTSDMKYSRLVSVTESNAYNETLPPHILNWSYLPSFNYSSTTITTNQTGYNFPFDEEKFISGDMNCDGLCDIIGISPKNYNIYNGNSTTTVYETLVQVYSAVIDGSNSITYQPSTFFIIPGTYDWSSPSGKSLFYGSDCGSTIIDFDGDGINEMLIPYFTSSNGICEFTFGLCGQKYDKQGRTFELPDNSEIPGYTSGDINNDGKDEIIFIEKSGERINNMNMHQVKILRYNKYYNPNGGNNLLMLETSLSLPMLKPERVFLSDMDGDGLKDLFVIDNTGYYIFWNQGNGITETTFSYNNMSEFTRGLSNKRMILPGDFNGDGLMDILSNATDEDSWYFYINKGNGSFTSSLAYNFDIHEQSGTEHDNDRFDCQIFDFDFDGKDDVIITKAMYFIDHDRWGTWGIFEKTYTSWLRSNGTVLEIKKQATSNREDDALSFRYITGDFDGDGRQELINYGYDCYNSTNADSDPIMRLYDNNNYTVSSGKVISVTGDYGRKTDITYSSLTNPVVYTKGSNEAYPAPRYTLPLQVVSGTISDNGASGRETTSYKYSGLKIHQSGRGVLGFTSVESENITMNTKDKVRYAWNPTYYIPDTIYSTHTVGGYTATSNTEMRIVNKGSKKYFVDLYRTGEKDINGINTYTEKLYNDTCGYLMSELVDHGRQLYTTITYDSIIMVGGKYRPKLVTTTKSHYDDPSGFISQMHYTYDENNGLVTQQIENFHSDSLKLTTNYEYDSFGNLLSEVSTGSGIIPLTKKYEYEGTHRFVKKEYTVPESYVIEYEYDIRGNITRQEDNTVSLNSNVRTYEYNHWGDLVHSHNPGFGDSYYSKVWESDGVKCYYTFYQADGQPWVKTWYDNMGREVKTESVGPMNTVLSKTTTYNSKGQVTSVTEKNGGLSLSSSFEYDGRGRLETEVSSSGSTTDYNYDLNSLFNFNRVFRSITTTTSNKIVVKNFDAFGNLVEMKDPSSYYVSYYYSSNGNLSDCYLGGLENDDAIYSFTYDDVGNKISFTDPDAGTSTYKYDALGRMISQTDGRGIVSTSSYDYLGRLEYTTAGGDTTFYTYGTSGNDKLRLIEERLGYCILDYSYDEYGRVIREGRSVGSLGADRNYYYQYDNNGQLSKITFPHYSYQTTGKEINYSYDSYGNMVSFIGMSDNVTWTLTGHNGLKDTALVKVRSTPINYYTNVITEYDNNGYLNKQIMKYTGRRSKVLQNASYTFDASTGNLTSQRSNGNMYYWEDYTYDESDRLISVGPGTNSQNFSYEPNGNISSKHGIGNYTYDAEDKPHAVQSVDNDFGWIPDSNQVITYNAFGKVSHITSKVGSDTYTYDIVYGPDKQRWYSELYKNGNFVRFTGYGKNYELVHGTDGEITEYHYINGSDGLAVVYTVNTQNGEKGYYVEKDHLGTIRALYDYAGNLAFSATYDPWGKRALGTNALYIPFYRGFTGHEHIDELGLIDMNGRMYDPLIGRFLSPDPFIQMPDNSQSFNRYSYCMNNPLKYTDPSGEYAVIDDIIAAAVGGIINLATNAFQGNIHNIGDGFAAFGAGAVGGLGALYPEFGGWAWGGATVGATNAWLGGATSGKDIALGAGVGVISGVAGGVAGQLAGQNIGGIFINGFNVTSPVLKGAITGAIGGAAGGYVGGYVGGLIMTGDVDVAKKAGINGLCSGAAVGGVVGAGSGYRYAIKNNINPWTGKAINSFTIGEGMETNPQKGWMGVDKIAEDLGSGYYKPDSRIPMSDPYNGSTTTSNGMYDNAIWIENNVKGTGAILYDRGPVGNNSQYYNMEVGRTMNYPVIKVTPYYNSSQSIRIIITHR